MITIREVKKSYGSSSLLVEVLRGVSLQIPSGQFVSIMGPSGCGKSTLLHLLGGLDRLDAGEIFLEGIALHALDDDGLTRLRREKIGIVFQFFNLLPTLTAEENIQLPGLLQGLPAAEARRRSAALLAEVGLEHRSHHLLHQLSGGEMQRIALARALLLNPPVILADEPTGNLDSEASARVVTLLRQLGQKHGTTIIMVTHSSEIAAVADRQIIMRDGQILPPSPTGLPHLRPRADY